MPPGASLERFDIGKIFQPSRRLLVRDQCGSGNERNPQLAHIAVRRLRSGGPPIDAIDPREDVDPLRREPELHHPALRDEISGLKSERGESEAAQRLDQTIRVVRRRMDEDIDVSGESRTAVVGEGVASDDDELSP